MTSGSGIVIGTGRCPETGAPSDMQVLRKEEEGAPNLLETIRLDQHSRYDGDVVLIDLTINTKTRWPTAALRRIVARLGDAIPPGYPREGQQRATLGILL